MASWQSAGQIQQRVDQGDHVRIGTISLFTLIAIICLAVLAVLAFSTANASLAMSERQAKAMSELYLDEVAAQEFLAGVDDALGDVRDASTTNDGEGQIRLEYDEHGNLKHDKAGNPIVIESDESGSNAGERGVAAVSQALVQIRDRARNAVDNKVDITAAVNDNRVDAVFSCENGRMLNVVITIRDNATYRIDRWKMSAVQNEEQPEGNLWVAE